jgi:hypothetical protein
MKQVRLGDNKSVITAERKLTIGIDLGNDRHIAPLLLPGRHETSLRNEMKHEPTAEREFQKNVCDRKNIVGHAKSDDETGSSCGPT